MSSAPVYAKPSSSAAPPMYVSVNLDGSPLVKINGVLRTTIGVQASKAQKQLPPPSSITVVTSNPIKRKFYVEALSSSGASGAIASLDGPQDMSSEVANITKKWENSRDKISGWTLVESVYLELDALNGLPSSASELFFASLGIKGLLQLCRTVGTMEASLCYATALGHDAMTAPFIAFTRERCRLKGPDSMEPCGWDSICYPLNMLASVARLRASDAYPEFPRRRNLRLLLEVAPRFAMKPDLFLNEIRPSPTVLGTFGAKAGVPNLTLAQDPSWGPSGETGAWDEAPEVAPEEPAALPTLDADLRESMGRWIYPLVEADLPELAAQITGMMLELDPSELLRIRLQPDLLQTRVKEAVAVLEQAAAGKNSTAVATGAL